jgi:glycosyltransferase involved in cell wall biosynthesis
VEVDGVCRFYKNARVTFIRPSFIRLPIFDYVSFFFSSKEEITKQAKIFIPDIIIGFSSILTSYWGLKIAKKLNIPYIYYCYDNPSALNVPKPFTLIAEMIVKNIMKNSAGVLTINKALNDYVISLGANPTATRVIPQGVDFERFNPLKFDSHSARKKYAISDTDILLFFMGWLYKFSGLKEVVLELSKVKDEYPNLRLMIVGYGDDYQSLKNVVDRYNLQDRVILTGKKPYEEIPELISAADICLLSAHNDDVIKDIVPIKMYEYLAMHKPVISTKLPGILKEFGQDSGVIYADSPKDVIRTATGLGREDIQKNSLMAKEFIKDYDWDNIVYKFEEILEYLVEGSDV